MHMKLGVEGQPWTDAENDLLVADYLDMLKLDIAGVTIQKLARRRELQKLGLNARTVKSIELKQLNLSAVLSLLGYRWVRGLLPYNNYQESLVSALQRNDIFSQLNFIFKDDVVAPKMPTFTGSDVFVSSPQAKPLKLPQNLIALVRKINPAERDHRARELGKAGEAFVLDVEKRRLLERGQTDLVNDVVWVADTEGDGLGYDVRSFDSEGRELHIEVKTTNGGDTTPFMLTANEERVSRADQSWKLYRVHRFFQNPRIFIMDPPMSERAAMATAVWKISPGVAPGN